MLTGDDNTDNNTDENDGTYTLMVNRKLSPYRETYDGEVSMKVGEKFILTVEDENGNIQDVTWEFSKEGICTMDGNNVVGAAAGKLTISATIGDQTYTCYVIVK